MAKMFSHEIRVVSGVDGKVEDHVPKLHIFNLFVNKLFILFSGKIRGFAL